MATERPVIEVAKRFTGWNILAAVLFILLGLFAIIEPARAVGAFARLLAWLLIFGGVAHLIASLKGGSAKQLLFQVLSAIAFVLGGLYILMHPQLAINTLTALLAVPSKGRWFRLPEPCSSKSACRNSCSPRPCCCYCPPRCWASRRW